MSETLPPPGKFDDHAFLDYDSSIDFNLYEIGNYSCPSLYSYGPVARTRDIFHFVLSGHGKLIIRNKEFDIQNNQGFLIPKGEKAFYIADKDDPWSYFWLHLGGSRLDEMWKKSGLSADSPVFISNSDTPTMYNLIEQLSRNRNRELFCMAKVYEIMDFVVSTSVNKAEIVLNRQLEYVRRTIHIIQIKYSEPLSIDAIADMCGLNRNYLSHLFKNATGKSIHAYLTDYRMKNAVRLLRETDESIQNISFLVGYNDMFTFSKAFKKLHGCSPSEFRNAMRCDS